MFLKKLSCNILALLTPLCLWGTAKEESSASIWRAWVKRLGSEKWQVREKAFQYLVRHLDRAEPYLLEALKHREAEIRWRAQQILSSSRIGIVYFLVKEIAPSGGYGYYQGQFLPLSSQKSQLASVFSWILSQERFLNQIISLKTSGQWALKQKYIALRAQRDRGLESKLRYLVIVATGELRLQEVAPALERFVRRHPNSPHFSSAISSLYRLGIPKYWRRRVDYLERLLKRKPLQSHHQIYGELAQLYREVGLVEKTIFYYQKAIRLHPSSHYYYNLACAYAVSGKVKEALDALEQAVVRGYRDYEWLVRDRDLASLYGHPRFQRIVEKLAKRK